MARSLSERSDLRRLTVARQTLERLTKQRSPGKESPRPRAERARIRHCSAQPFRVTPSWVSSSIRRDLAYSEDASLILTWAWTGYLAHHLVEIEASRFLSRWEFFEALEPLRDQCHSAIVHIGVMDEPLVVEN